MPCNNIQDAAKHKTGQVCRRPIDQESIRRGRGACSELPLSPGAVGVGNASLVVTACVSTCYEGNRCNVRDWRCALEGRERKERQFVQCQLPTASLGGPSYHGSHVPPRVRLHYLVRIEVPSAGCGVPSWHYCPMSIFPLLGVRPNRVFRPVR